MSGAFRIDEQVTPGDIRRYIPAIVTYDTFPTFPLIWPLVEEVVRNTPGISIDEEILNNVQIIEIDELEAMEKIMSSTGITLLQLLDDKNSSQVYKRLPFSNYLHDRYRNAGIRSNDYLSDRFNEVANHMTQRLFGRDLP